MSREYKKPLYGNVKVYDYEHSGDSAKAYEILRRHNVREHSFQYNGDGNVALIEFTVEFISVNECNRMENELTDAGYGCYFINMDDYSVPAIDYVKKITETLQVTDMSLQQMIELLPSYYDFCKSSNDNDSVYATITLSRNGINREPDKLAQWVEVFKCLGCAEVSCQVERDSINIRGLCKFSQIKENKSWLLDESKLGSNMTLIFCRQHKD